MNRDCESRVVAPVDCQRHHPGHSRYLVTLKVQSLHSRMPGPVIHTPCVCYQPAWNKAACRSAYPEWRYVYVDPVANMSSASSTDSSISMRSAHSAISSTYASLSWTLSLVADGVQMLPLVSISLPQDADLHPELTRCLKLFFRMVFNT